MKTSTLKISIILAIAVILTGCQDQFDEFPTNPNVAGENNPIPPSYLLGRVLFEMYNGGGVTDNRPGNVYEGPWNLLGSTKSIHRW